MNNGRLAFLDTLRGLAALYVVLYHLILLPNPDLETPRWIRAFALSGGAGVTLFFVVSAFSLFFTMPFRLAKPRPILSFYLHRFFRIAPLFYLAIVFYEIRDHVMYGVDHGVGEVLRSALFIFNLDPQGQQGFVWASWTIGVEMLFYAAFPLIYLRTRSIYAAVSWTLGFLLAWQAIQTGLTYLPLSDAAEASVRQWSVFKHLPIFGAGMVVFYLLDGRYDAGRTRRGRDLGLMLLLGAAFLYSALLHGWLPAIFGTGYYWQGIVCILLVIGLCFAPLRLVVNRLTTHLGELSYSIYLVHPSTILFLAPVYPRIYAWAPVRSVALLASLALTLAVVVVVSELTYRFVERPGISLGRRLHRRLTARGQAATAAPATAPAGSSSAAAAATSVAVEGGAVGDADTAPATPRHVARVEAEST